MDLILLGSVLVAVFGFFLFYHYGLLRKNEKNWSPEKGNSAATTVIDEGECRSRDGGDDVIIVGAGVAGAALAHTLGRVMLFFFSICFVCVHYLQFLELD